MVTELSNERLSGVEVLAVSLGGTADAGIPIAASRAGAIGVLDLSHERDAEHAVDSAQRLARLGAGRFGFILAQRRTRIADALLGAIEQCELILLDRASADGLSNAISRCRSVARRVGVIVTGASEAECAERAEADVLIAKGHEAGGVVGELSSFLLLQQLRRSIRLPIYVWGGIGLYSAAAARAGGAEGVVLDWQLALTRESPLCDAMRRRVAAMDGTETVAVPLGNNTFYRCFDQPGFTAPDALRALAESADACNDDSPPLSNVTSADDTIAALLDVDKRTIDHRLWPIAQDAACAGSWADAATSVGRAIRRLVTQINRQIRGAARARILSQGSPLARSHGTNLPVVQGPMTRVSDNAAFCEAVADGGGLPFLALALMRRREVRELLEETHDRMGDRPWGVGVLGFVERDLQREQLSVIEEIRPRFAIIAGGRPDQAAAFEAKGIATYLHVPSPAMLAMYVREGARRFIFEGRECGGHVGPRTSLVLWNMIMRELMAAELTDEECAKVHVLFAGGIHDATSGAMVSALSQPVVERGMKVGVLLGTAYLFTEEAVATGAILQNYQDMALATDHTVLFETGPGHTVRCAESPYLNEFESRKQQLRAELRPETEIRKRLEESNVGRLRIASKGLKRAAGEGNGRGALVAVPDSEQLRDGMYMLGQLACLRDAVSTIRELHADVCHGAVERLASIEPRIEVIDRSEPPAPPPLDVAIVGMSCVLPGATTVEAFWHNVLTGKDVIREVPPDRFEAGRWFDPDRSARDKSYSKWGGFIDDIAFDPLKYGIPPNSIRSIEPVQLLALELVDRALCDAGYADENPSRDRTSIIIGAGGGMGELGTSYGVRSMLPQFLRTIDAGSLSGLPEWTEDSFPGFLLNVIAGRAANRFNLGGVNYVVDAACASSLASVYLACRELSDGTSDMVIAGGCDTMQHPFAFMAFSKTGALSPKGRSRTFDADADGIAISEGLATVVLKRRTDAERDGDRIYAVIRGAAGGSDGRSKSMTAPCAAGQTRTLERVYAQARFSPATVGIFEAHGTGTSLGDETECRSLGQLLTRHGASPGSAAIGSVKSMIGHTKCAAGVAGLMKMALSLYHRVLPPTIHVRQPNPKAGLIDGPLYVNSELRPWIRGSGPRRAAVSAFGFGGSNFHAVLEEYEDGSAFRELKVPDRARPAELFVLRGDDRSSLAKRVRGFLREVTEASRAAIDRRPGLADLAYTHHVRPASANAVCVAALVADNLDELITQLRWLADALASEDRITARTAANDAPGGVYFCHQPVGAGAPIAFLFPGQGSQHPNMVRDLAIEFSECRGAIERADAVLRDCLDRPLSRFVFPPPVFSDADRARAIDALKATNIAQPALGACDVAMLRLLDALGLRADMTAGHSYGELVALHAAGCFDEATLYRLSRERGDAIAVSAGDGSPANLGGMLAVRADESAVRAFIGSTDEVWIANINSDKQIVVSGSTTGIDRMSEKLHEAGIGHMPIPVACAFHSPLMQQAQERFRRVLQGLDAQPPQIAVFSNTTASAYPNGQDAIRVLLADQLVSPVRFAEQIEAMYRAGARVFVEVGPNNVLTKLVDSNLRGRPHVAIATAGRSGTNGVTAFLHAVAGLIAQGVPINCDRLYAGRDLTEVDLAAAGRRADSPENLPAHLWLVNGAYARPASQPPRTFAPPEPATERPSIAVEQSPAQQPRTNDGVPPTRQSALRDGERRSPPSSSDSGGGTRPQATPAYMASSQDSARWTSPEPTAPMAAADVEVFAQYQQVMRRFLETQQAVMEAYLGRSADDAADSAAAPSVIPPPSVEVPSGPPSRRFEPSADGEQRSPQFPGDHRVETTPAPADGQALDVSQQAASSASLAEQLVELVSKRTGYPPDMLDLDANMEADLGIDSIKRVEIIAALRKQLLPELDKPATWFTEQMSSVTTMRDIAEGVGKLLAEVHGGSIPAHIAASDRAASPDAPVAPSPVATTVIETHASLEERLVHIVSKRTGYPPEMLDLDANMEADLGIDSIKRVEIIAAFRKEVRPKLDKPPAWFTETIAAVTTMREIVTGVAKLVDEEGTSPSAAMRASDAAPLLTSSSDDCPRCVATAVDAPIDMDAAIVIPKGVILLTDDGEGFAQRILARIEAASGTAFILGDDALTDRGATLEAIERVRRAQGPIGGIIHLRPLRVAPEFPEVSHDSWVEHSDAEVKSLLFMIQAIADELRDADRRSVTVASVGAGGSDFGTQSPVEAAHCWRGALAGLLKTAAREWPHARFRNIDTDAPLDPDELLQELSIAGPVDVGFRQGRRLVVEARRVELPDVALDSSSVPLDQDSVVLVTGGARGITAQVAEEIAQRTGATLILLGRTPLPEGKEDAAIVGVTDVSRLRGIYAKRLAQDGKRTAAADVERHVRSLISRREVLATLSALRNTGSRVEYIPCDVVDQRALEAVIRDVVRRYGGIDAVVHGAGIIEDKYLVDKTAESFDRVLATKLKPVLTFCRLLDPQRLKLFVMFSSVAGFFGNPGQGDYAAANETLNRMAHRLNSLWPGKVVAINWGPWQEIGMVTADVARQLAQRGIGMVSVAAGRRAAWQEMIRPKSDDVCVVVGPGPWVVPAVPLGAAAGKPIPD